jgi:hypothetical protein
MKIFLRIATEADSLRPDACSNGTRKLTAVCKIVDLGWRHRSEAEAEVLEIVKPHVPQASF